MHMGKVRAPVWLRWIKHQRALHSHHEEMWRCHRRCDISLDFMLFGKPSLPVLSCQRPAGAAQSREGQAGITVEGPGMGIGASSLPQPVASLLSLAGIPEP